MTAQGKINASTVAKSPAGTIRILVTRDAGKATTEMGPDGLGLSRVKTGAIVATVKSVVAVRVKTGSFHRSQATVYDIHTDQGRILGLAPIQTMWLAPEDSAAVERAHAEALELDQERTLAELAVKAEMDAWAALDRAMEPVLAQALAESVSEGAPGGVTSEEALKAHADGDYALALSLAADQKALQEVSEPEAETLGDIAADLLSPVPARPQLANPVDGLCRWFAACANRATVVVKHPVLGDVASCARCQVVTAVPAQRQPVEDLADAALAQAVDPDVLELGDLSREEPADPRCVPGDVVRIHRGTRLYEVLRVQEDSSTDRLTGTVLDQSMARVAPCDPEDDREPQWIHVDLLHVVPPVAHIRTEPVTADQALDPSARVGAELVAVAGPGWAQDRPVLRQVATSQLFGDRLPHVFLLAVDGTPEGPLPRAACPVAALRIGDALLVDGRCHRVVWDGGLGEPHLEPARWRARTA